MKYAEFLETIKSQLTEMMDPEFTISLKKIQKNNGVCYDGLIIINPLFNISPTIYVNPYYHRYLDGVSIKDICEDILLTYSQHAPTEDFNVDLFTNFDLCKSHIVPKLINYEKNVDLLKNCPHVKFQDLAIVFQFLLSNAFDNTATILIHNEHIEMWNVSAEDLYNQALINSPKLLPYEICKMKDIFPNTPFAKEFDMEEEPFYILTNKNRLNGASVITYPNLLHKLAEKYESDLILIPSSIHEWLFIPAFKQNELWQFDNMINEVNEIALTDSEILSDHAYYYSYNLKQFMDNKTFREDIA